MLGTDATAGSSKKDPAVFVSMCVYLSICTHSVPPPFSLLIERVVLRVVVCGAVLVVRCVMLFELA